MLKSDQVFAATVVFLLLGFTVPVNARQGKQEEKAEPARQEQQAKPAQQQQTRAPQQQQQARPAQQQQTRASQAPQRTQQAIATQRAQPALRLSARSSSRIPDDRFRANFGSEHRFHIGSPMMVGGYSRFQYGGFWFGFIDPWPVSWYYTDNVYIDYMDGGYYMFNPYYPGVRVGISIVL